MKIGLVTGEYPPMKGGVGDYTRAIAIHLSERGHSVRVITDQRCVQPDHHSGLPVVHPIVSARWGWLDLWRVRIASTDLDIINIQYQAAAYGAMRPPIHYLPHITIPPTTVTFHDLRQPYLFPKAKGLRERAIWGLSRSAAGVILTNEEDFQQCQVQEGLPPLAKIPIASNIPCAPPETFSPSEWRAYHGIGTDEFVIGYFGFLNNSKGGEILMHALATLHANGLSPRLMLIGDHSGSSDHNNTDYAQRVNNLARNFGIVNHILRTGYLAPADTSAALLSCDLMVLPYRDGVSFRRGSFLACLAHGRATVTTLPRVQLVQLRSHENVILTQPNADAIARAILEVHSDPDLRQNIETGALRLSKNFQWSHIAEQLEEFYKDILSLQQD